MKELKNYIHLYLGCQCKVSGGTLILTHEVLQTWDFAHHGIKPMLREIESLTNEEGKMLFGSVDWSIMKNTDAPKKIEWSPEQFVYLLSKHFDIFGLIPSGIAVSLTDKK